MLIKDSQKTIQLCIRQLYMSQSIQNPQNPRVQSPSNPQPFLYGQQYKYKETTLQTSNSAQNQQNALPQYRINPSNAVPSLLVPLAQLPPEKGVPENTIPQKQRFMNTSSLVYNLFYKQHRLIKNPKQLVIFFAILVILFLAIAAFSLYFGLKVKELKIKYVQQNKCIGQGQVSPKCSLSFELKQDMPGPLYVIQYIQNISINHRKFLQQVSLDQLRGKVISKEIAEKQCGRFVLNTDIYSQVSWANQTLAPSNIASPCGVKAQGFFNDTFSFYHNGEKLEIDSSKIHQRKIFDIHRAPSSQTTQWVDPQQLHFKQYLVDGSLMTKKKLWGMIDKGLKAGKYSLVVNNNYRIPDMLLSKGLFFSTTTVMGGRQAFYPIVFAILATVCIGYIIFIEIKLKDFPENNIKFKINPYPNDPQKNQSRNITKSSHV